MGNYREFRQQTRQKRRKRALRRLLAFLLAALAVLGLAWVITWAIERIGGGGSGAPSGPAASEGQTGLVGSVLAPLPMQVEQGGTAWQSVGPVRQTGGYTVVSPGAAALTLPERGLVDNSYFADAVFLGDSVTEGLDTYANPVKGVAAVYGYRSAGPSAILNRTSLHNFATETDEIALDKIAERAPKRLYILLGANALARDGEAEENAFLAYYGQMLDLIRETLGEGVTIYVQAMTPVRPEYTQKALAEIEAMGYGGLPVCIAKTQYSFSDDPKLLAAPEGFTMTVRDVRLSAGAGFVVVIMGSIMTMPGLPKKPAAESIDVDETGRITGLF